ncbi:MAG: biopolymer transporter ExbD [Zoogloeaceae bacterium]|jgi:biopolymer transport protein ExbD|nr:biopolymer transporter ExbD [Zoogloeaceae bacterium]
MGMNVGSGSEADEAISTINTTPLVDVMLVLLIIFLITIPVAIHVVPVQLPQETNKPREMKPEHIQLSVTREGTTYWNQEVVSVAELRRRLKTAAQAKTQPEVQIRGDAQSRYEPVGRIVLACQQAGILKIGFVTEPGPRG